MAGTTASMIDVAEVHDAFSVCEPMALESLGMAPPGRGAALSGELYHTGSRRVNPRGGILGAGHPLGATGLAQAAEVFAQLRGRGGKEAGGERQHRYHTGHVGGRDRLGGGGDGVLSIEPYLRRGSVCGAVLRRVRAVGVAAFGAVRAHAEARRERGPTRSAAPYWSARPGMAWSSACASFPAACG